MSVKVSKISGKTGWWVKIVHQGKRTKRRFEDTAAGKKAAEAVAMKIQVQLAAGDLTVFAPPPALAMTFRAHVDDWLATHVKGTQKPGTYEWYERTMRKRWLPVFGDLLLPEMTRAKIIPEIKTLLASDLATPTIKGAFDALRSCLTYAVEIERLAVNPAAKLGKHATRTQDKDRRRKIEPYTLAHLRALLGAADREQPAWSALYHTLAKAGLRIGEALTLQRDDLDFVNHRVLVRRTWGSRKKALGEKRIGAPKGNRDRHVDLSDDLEARLQEHLQIRDAEAVVAGQDPSPWVFPGRAGMPILPGAFWQNLWRPLLKRTGLPPRKPHVLRHTYASHLLQSRVNPRYVMEQLGHSSIKITIDLYGHLILGDGREAVNKLATAIGAPAAPQLHREPPVAPICTPAAPYASTGARGQNGRYV